MFPGGRHLQNPPTGPPQPVPFPSQFYYGAPPAVSNPGWYQNPAPRPVPPTQRPVQHEQQHPPGIASGSRDILADSYERMRNEMRSLQGVQPAAPPPPSMDATKGKIDPLTQLLGNKDVSLSSLLEAAMDPSLGSNNRTEDPIMKKAILDKCEGKIVQLYRHRISGQGIFFPMEQPKSKKINGSSLLAFHHPRLEFNMLPIPPIWMCPEVSLEVKEEEKVNKEVKKPETISKVDSQAKRSKSPAALMMQSVNVEGDSLTFDAKVPPPIFKPATPSPPGIGVPPAPVPAPTISEPPTPVPAPTMTVPDPYATTAIDIWAEMEKERRRKEKEKQWEVLMTVEKRKKKKKRRSRSRSSSEGNLKEKSRTRRSRSRSRRSHSRRSRSRRSHRRSRSRSRKRHRSHSKRRRRRSSSLSLSPPRHRPISPHEMRYGESIRRSQTPLGRPVSPTRVHGMVGEWPPTENVWPQMGNPPNFHAPPPPYYGYPNADPYAPVMRPQFPMGPFTPQIQPPPGPVGPYGAPPFVDGPREFIPTTPQPQFGVGTKGNEKRPVERFVQEVIIIDDDVPVEQPANPAPSESTSEEVLMAPGVGEDSIEIYPPGEQPPVNKPKFLGVESEYTKPLRVKFRKLLAPIHKILDYIRHYQREVPNSYSVVKNLEAGNCEFEGLYTLVDGILCKLAVERGKSEFFKVVLPEVRRYRIIKELHKVHHEYSIHQLQEIIADVFPQEERQILNKFLVSVFRDCRECDALDVQRRAHKSGHLEGHDGNEKTRKTSKGGKRGSSEKDDKRGFSKDEIKNGEEELRAGVVGSKEERGSRKKGEERGSEEERMRQDGRHHSSDSRGKRERNADVQKKADDGSRDKLKARQTLRRREEPQKGKNSDKAETDLGGKEEKKGKSICVENVERMAENDYSENDKTPKVDLASKVSGQPSQNNKKADPPKANPEDFKCRVRRVQLNVPEFKNHIEALEGAEKKTTDSALILKAGMLCRRFPSTSGDGKAEVKIVVDVTSLKEMVAIVHTMASVHAPLQKTMTVFTKHFVPIDGLELAVKKVLDECSKCKKP